MKNIKIGQCITAYPKEGADWVECSSGDQGEKDYYRDVYCPKTGRLLYCWGETCRVEGFNIEYGVVKLSNGNIDNREYSPVFEISIEQFQADFV